jgi:hypothetical protein
VTAAAGPRPQVGEKADALAILRALLRRWPASTLVAVCPRHSVDGLFDGAGGEGGEGGEGGGEGGEGGRSHVLLHALEMMGGRAAVCVLVPRGPQVV